MAVEATQLALIGIDGLLYSSLLFGVVLWRRIATPVIDDTPTAFGLLEKALRQTPGLSPGFTWEEAIASTRSSGFDVDWTKVMRSLDGYEAYRYGGGERPSSDNREVIRLTILLKRRGAIGT